MQASKQAANEARVACERSGDQGSSTYSSKHTHACIPGRCACACISMQVHAYGNVLRASASNSQVHGIHAQMIAKRAEFKHRTGCNKVREKKGV